VLAGIKGQRVVELKRMTPDVLAGILPRVYPQMLAVVRDHQDAGRPCFIATAASQPAAEILADALVMDGAMGTCWEIEDGVYTGRLDGPFAYGEGKAQRLREFAAEREIDLAHSWAYSDAVSDLPMLEAVGHPVAVNPDAPLAEVAAREGW
jgi:HAD superfamily hydrolase (TIGR01490 family)